MGLLRFVSSKPPKLRSPTKSMHDDLPIGTTPPGSKHARGLTSKFYTEEQSIHPSKGMHPYSFFCVCYSVNPTGHFLFASKN
jgi:hypothetical protein